MRVCGAVLLAGFLSLVAAAAPVAAPHDVEEVARTCRAAMYGSILSGGLSGFWCGEIEPESRWPVWKVVPWQSTDLMRYLKEFILSEARRYADFVPATNLVSPNRSGKPGGNVGWAYCVRTADRQLYLLYFEKGCGKIRRRLGDETLADRRAARGAGHVAVVSGQAM
ncbi:MAG: hypothetical protein NT049_15000 [Planctomycetota bacterium]|nr:hypothetical protein [Planctomycetota bacterium]